MMPMLLTRCQSSLGHLTELYSNPYESFVRFTGPNRTTFEPNVGSAPFHQLPLTELHSIPM